MNSYMTFTELKNKYGDILVEWLLTNDIYKSTAEGNRYFVTPDVLNLMAESDIIRSLSCWTITDYMKWLDTTTATLSEPTIQLAAEFGIPIDTAERLVIIWGMRGKRPLWIG